MVFSLLMSCQLMHCGLIGPNALATLANEWLMSVCQHINIYSKILLLTLKSINKSDRITLTTIFSKVFTTEHDDSPKLLVLHVKGFGKNKKNTLQISKFGVTLCPVHLSFLFTLVEITALPLQMK